MYNTLHWDDELQPYLQNYSKLINICVNHRLERRYNLTYHGYSKIEYCLSNAPAPGDETFSSILTSLESSEFPRLSVPDILKITLFTIVSTFSVTLLVANLCDIFGVNRSNTIVSSFSIRRNWNKLTEESTSDIYLDFAYIDGLRVVINFFILYGHCMMVPLNLPVENPEDAEAVSGL